MSIRVSLPNIIVFKNTNSVYIPSSPECCWSALPDKVTALRQAISPRSLLPVAGHSLIPIMDHC